MPQGLSGRNETGYGAHCPCTLTVRLKSVSMSISVRPWDWTDGGTPEGNKCDGDGDDGIVCRYAAAAAVAVASSGGAVLDIEDEA